MKKSVLSLTVLMAFLNAQASVQNAAVEQRALAVLLENSGKVSELNQETTSSTRLSKVLASALLVGSNANIKTSNSCELDTSDNAFKCTFTILDRDDDGTSESSTSIRYQLEVDRKTNLPSQNMLFLSVDVERAG